MGNVCVARGCFRQNGGGGKKKENIVENHLQFRHVQLADNREGWGGEAIHLSRHQMLPVNLF